MAERRLHKILSAVVKIKPGEEVLAVLVFFYFFLITAPFGIVKSLRDANFLDDLKVENLPFAYLSATQALDKEPLEYRAGEKFTLDYLVLVSPQPPSPQALQQRLSARDWP